jgi:hypothetical protein
MRTKREALTAKILNNPLGRKFLRVPKGKEIYLVTRSSAHYYTGEFSKTGVRLITTGNSLPGGDFVYNRIFGLAKSLAFIFLLLAFPKGLLPLIGLSTTSNSLPTTYDANWNDWSDPAAATVEDTSSSTGSGDAKKNDWGGFGFSIPGGSAIQGIAVQIAANHDVYVLKVSIYNGTVWSAEKNHTNDEYTPQTLGGASDLWGESWTVSGANGIGVYLLTTHNTSFFVRWIKIQITYGAGVTPANVKTINTVAIANEKTVNTVAAASVKTWNTVA